MKKLLSAVLALAMAGAVMATPALAEEPDVTSEVPVTEQNETPSEEQNDPVQGVMLSEEGASTADTRTADVFMAMGDSNSACIYGVKRGKTLNDAIIDGVLVFPDQVDGLYITFIGQYPFHKAPDDKTGLLNQKVSTIQFPQRMTMLEQGSLACVGPVEKIVVPSRVGKIEDGAFNGALVDEIVIEGNPMYTEIKAATFNFCGITKKISLPADITKIDMNAFYHCIALEEIDFAGTSKQWRAITIEAQGNEILTKGCVKIVCQGDNTVIEGSHDWVLNKNISTPATCSAAGTNRFLCSKCGNSRQETVPADPNAHSWDEGKVTTEPTTSAEGEKTVTCTLCGETRTEAVAKLEHYTVLEGKEQTVEKNGSEPTFRFDIPFAHFHELRMDGNVVDPAHYTAWEGSTYVRLSSSYLAGLQNGSHTMTAVDDNGVTVDAVFTVQTPAAPESEHPEIAEAIANGTWGVPDPTPAPTAAPAATAAPVRTRSSIPQTADDSAPALAVVLMLVSLLGMAGVAMHRRHQ